MSNTCPIFCGCEFYMQTDSSSISPKVYIFMCLMIILITVSAKRGAEWFIYKDYYPLKERSPVLCILTNTFITVHLLLYPLIYVYNYFTRNFWDIKRIYTVLFYAVDGSIYLIYIMRAFRLVYAHEVDSSRSKTRIFKFLKHELYMALALIGVILLKVLPVIFNPNDDDSSFYTAILFNSFYTHSGQVSFAVKDIVIDFFWTVLLIYCLQLQRKVHKKYSMFWELLVVILSSTTINIILLILISIQAHQFSLFVSLCSLCQEYPILQILQTANLACMYFISIEFPLRKKAIYHSLLPIGRAYDITKTMRDFLLEKELMEIFTSFLEYRDQEENTNSRIKALDYWKKLMVIKYNVNGDEEPRLQSIKKLIEDIEDKPIKEIHSKIISDLKQSILSFESEMVSSSDSDKYLSEINERIEELEQIFLQKLDQLYKQEYRQTKSYYRLKDAMNVNKKINVNMILLNMAVMVESEDPIE